MWETYLREGASELANAPFLLLQQTAVLGILSMVLIVFRTREVSDNRMRTMYGLVLGVTGYLLTALVSDFVKSPIKPYLRNDILFLAGLLGGQRGGAIAYVFLLAARLQFGGMPQAAAATVDMAVMTGCGIVMHGLINSKNLLNIGLRHLLLLGTARVVAGMLGVLAVTVLNLAPENVSLLLAVRRIFSTPVAFMLLLGLLAIFRIDAQHRQLQKQETISARTHPITGLFNRRALLEHLAQRSPPPQHQQGAMVLLEATNYAEMLMSQGHDWSVQFWQDIDRFLGEAPISHLLKPYSAQAFQFADITMAVVLHGIATEDVERMALATVLHQELTHRLHAVSTQGPRPQLRMGVADCATDRMTNPAVLLRDVSLHLQGWVPGGQAVQYFHQTFAETAAVDAEVLGMLVEWIDNHSPPLQYQPKFHLSSRAVTGAEALLRARDSVNRPISPVRILTMASRHQLLGAFEWCTIEAVAHDALNCRALNPRIPLSVNISGASLATTGFDKRVCRLLDSLTLPKDCLLLELTETSALPDVEAVSDNVRQLGEYGIRLSLDDFGTGYSGLAVLARIPFVEVKIDHGMVAGIDNPRTKAAIQIAFESAQRYGATFVVEGVETQAQSDVLHAMGIHYGQGYLFAETIPLDTLVQLALQSGLPVVTS